MADAKQSWLYVCSKCGPRVVWHEGRPSEVRCGCGKKLKGELVDRKRGQAIMRKEEER